MSDPAGDPTPEQVPAAATEPALSSSLVRAIGPDAGRALPRPQPPSRRFTWGVRAGVIVAALFYGVLTVWGRLDADQPMSTPAVVLFGLAILVAVVALIEVWCWAGRPRFSASQSEAITADLSLAQKQTVRRMARGRRGPEVVELRARAAASAWAQRQNNAVAPAFLALVNVGNLAQNSIGAVGLVLALVILLITSGTLGDALWLGRRARLLSAALEPEIAPSAGTS